MFIKSSVRNNPIVSLSSISSFRLSHNKIVFKDGNSTIEWHSYSCYLTAEREYKKIIEFIDKNKCLLDLSDEV